jgi:hypothetical protein
MADADIDILIRAKDLASKSIRGVRGELGKLDGVGSKAARNLTTNMVRIGAVGAVSLAGGVALGARSLGHLERVTNLTNATLETTAGVSGQTTESIRKHAEALEQLTTADDKAIQEGQNMLLTFTKIGEETFPAATDAVVNLAIAMAKGDVANADFKGSALQVGKALNDPVKGITALRRAGIQFTADQEKQIKTLVKSGDVLGAQKVILAELETQFGKAGEAAGTGFEADLRRLEDAGEDATMALAKGVMPMLTRAAKWLQTKLADPAVIRALEDLGNELGVAMGKALDFIETIDFKAIGAGLSVAKDAVGAIVGAFLSMPPWVQQAVVTGWGLNKLTGGALGDVVGALGSGLIKGVLGMNAGVVNINAGVVNGGGLPGAAGGAAGAAGGVAAATLLAGAAITAAAAAGVVVVQQAISASSTKHAQAIQTQTSQWLAQTPTREQMVNGLAGVRQGIADLQSNPLLTLVQGDALTSLQAMEGNITRQIAEIDRLREQADRTKDDTVAAQNRTRDAALETKREAGRGLAITASATRNVAPPIVGAIRANRPIISVNVVNRVTPAAITSTTTTVERHGPTTGSSGSGSSGNAGNMV